MSPYSTKSVVNPGSMSPTHFESHSDSFPLNSNQRDVVWNASAGSMVQGSTSKKRIRREFGRMGRNIRQRIFYGFFQREGDRDDQENFQLLVSDLQLCDLVAQGQQFTWMNKKEEENFVMERMNKAFASVEWIETCPNYALTNHPIISLDHSPIALDFDLKLPFQRRPFKFERMWITHPSCKEVVQRAWGSSTHGSRAYQLMHKVYSVRKEFVHWNRNVFGRIEQEIN
nr:hypothetical protein CFP56_75006 [Quercus suber]